MRDFLTPLRNRTRAFCRDEDGSMTVEAVMILPFLLWAFLATFTYFDVYRAKNLALKANYAISDLLSRENTPIDMNYLLGIEDIYTYLTQGGDPAWVRVTVVRCTEDCTDEAVRTLDVGWSKATDGLAALTDEQVQETYADVIPLLAEGDWVTMVETMAGYEPPFSVYLTGIRPRDMRDIVLTRPRFASQLCWNTEPICDNYE
ncbi:TadE/TadG family type IV pilus assembly protein [Aliiroseovarius sp.]|uniref:TadE/TadG family type IV pilus assembly protein n=1 Tax=Aliiroseovarius sp. TaxID=1872442 RepID=UPI003BACBB3F